MLSAILFAALLTTPANAGVTVHVGVPGVQVHVNPWHPSYRPAPRSGFVWVVGDYDRFGNWTPGRWVPTYSRAGYAWVDGYWNGHAWTDGFWRPAMRSGYVWSGGYYSHGRWVTGGWASHPHGHAVVHNEHGGHNGHGVQDYRDNDHRSYDRGSNAAYAGHASANDGRGESRSDDDGRGQGSGEGRGQGSGGQGGEGRGQGSGGQGSGGQGSGGQGSGGQGSGEGRGQGSGGQGSSEGRSQSSQAESSRTRR